MAAWTGDQLDRPTSDGEGNPYYPDERRQAWAEGYDAAKADPVGAVEIAARLGVKRTTVDQWRQRDIGFPEPRWTVGGRPAWQWEDVEAWYTERSR